MAPPPPAELSTMLTRLDAVEAQLAADAARVDGPVGGVELRAYQQQVLARLRQIRDTMAAEGSSLDQLRAERDAAQREAAALRTQVAKLQYRVQHLAQHVHVEPPTTQ